MDKVKKIFSSNFFLSAVLVLAVGLTLSIFGGFCFTYGTNDDYALSLLMNGGEERLFFISYYVGFFFSHLQQLFPAVNCYAISQIALGVASLLAINYVFFCKLGKPLGAFISLIADVILFSVSIMVVQFTQTTTLVASAGTMLLIFARFFEQRKGFRIMQYIFSTLLVIISSTYRFMSFRVVAVFSFIFLFCILLSEIFRSEEQRTIPSKILGVLKKQWKFLICFVLIFAVCFGGNTLSNILKNADPSYVEYSNAEKGRSLITDYPMANYKANIDFYRENNVYSSEDVVLINRGHIDPDVNDTESMTNIGEFSVKYNQNGKSSISYAVNVTLKQLKATVKEVYGSVTSLKRFLPFNMSSRVFALCFAAFVLLAAAIIIIVWQLLRRKLGFAPLIYGSIPLKIVKILLALTWLAFFIIYKYSFISCLLLLVCGATLLTLRNSNWVHTISCWIFTAATMALYGYQVCFRLNFRSTFIFAIPAFLFMCCVFDIKNMKGIKDSTVFVRCLSAGIPVIIALVIAFNVQCITWQNNFCVNSGVYDTNVYDYISEHPDTTYAMIVPCALSVDPNYNNALLSPDMPENSIFYGSWNIYTDYNVNKMKELGIDKLFRDMINNDKLRLVTKNRDDYTRYFGKFFNNHYAQDGKKIRLEKEKTVKSTGTYWGGVKQNDPLFIYKVIEE